MKPPIVIAAFGTTSKARAAYERVDLVLKKRFAGHEIHWAYTSRIVRHHLKKRRIDASTPAEVVARLANEGHPWIVVQSLTMICGHEFHRLVNDVRYDGCRASIGHSLLCSPADHAAVSRALSPIFTRDEDEAVVFVGHGTDHCIWTVYPAFYQRMREMYGERAHGGMIEAADPEREVLIEKIKAAGFCRVRLVPFMLVAGVHFEEDLGGEEDSWKTAFEAAGLTVSLEMKGLVERPEIVDIFTTHIAQALDVIPASVAWDRRILAGGTRSCVP